MKQYPYHTVGEKYHEVDGKDITEIAKLIRKDLKALFSEHAAMKASVRIERYAGGQSIHVELNGTGMENRSNRGIILCKVVTDKVNQYNFNDSDIASDYNHVNFYTHVRIAS